MYHKFKEFKETIDNLKNINKKKVRNHMKK